MNRPLSRPDQEKMTALIAEKRRRLAKAEHSTRGYRDENGVWQGGLLSFVRYFWHVLEPGTPFVEGFALEAVVEHLEAVTFGEITKLLINVPPGFCKPVQVDEPVYTDRGFVRLGDIRIGDNVLTHKGRFRRVTAVHEQGEIDVVSLKTNGGRTIIAAPDHPFLTPRGWVAVGKLTDHDYVGAPKIIEPIKTQLVSAEEARLLGYLVGDGSISQRSLGFTNMDQEAIDDFIFCAEKCGFYAYATVHPNPKVKAQKVVLKSTKERWKGGRGSVEPAVLQWLRRHDLYRSDSYTKRIPHEVLASSPEIVANFVGAYWSCDGTFSVRHQNKKTSMIASATTVSRELANDLVRALWVLGINSRFRQINFNRNMSKRQPGDKYVAYTIISSDRHEVSKFAALPGLLSRKRRLAEKAFLDHFEPSIFADAVVSVQPCGKSLCRCLTVEEDSSFTVDGIAVHNSLLTDVFYPAWEWSAMALPHIRYVAFSYSSSLTERDNLKFRDLLISREFREMYPDVSLRLEGARKVSNDKHGWKLASSVGGAATGERADRILLDDPHNIIDSESQKIRRETIRWFRESMSSRLNNMETGAKIVIMQRVNEEDVSGTITTEMRDWTHLMIQMEFSWEQSTYPSDHEYADQPCATDIGWTDPRWRPNKEDCEGELAWPERFPETIIPSMRRDAGPFAWASQYQQLPQARGGGIFKTEWWQPAEIYMKNGKYPPMSYVVASLDGAYTEKQENDPSALTVWGIFQNEEGYNRVMLLHAWRKRLQFSGPKVPILPGEHESTWRRRAMQHWGLVEWVADTCKRFQADKLLIEAKATGISAAQSLRNSHGREGWGIELVDPKGDKMARAIAVQPSFSQEMVYAPDREWAFDLIIKEMANFPKGKYDDLTDTASMAIKHLRDTGLLRSDEERRAQEVEAVRHKGAPKPALYPGFRKRVA